MLFTKQSGVVVDFSELELAQALLRLEAAKSERVDEMAGEDDAAEGDEMIDGAALGGPSRSLL